MGLVNPSYSSMESIARKLEKFRKRDLRIGEFMTSNPHCVDSGHSLQSARTLMKTCGIRHLPVKDGGQLVGVISERDFPRDSNGRLDPDKELVNEWMQMDVFQVLEDESLSRVLEKMKSSKYGCAVVTKPEGDVLGIFTGIDAIRVLEYLVS